MKQTKYTVSFYERRDAITERSARIILPLVIQALPEIHSVVDFGCALGTWLSELILCLDTTGIDRGGVCVNTRNLIVKGLDGPWVNKELLKIKKSDFIEVNFEQKIALDMKYNLAISLEVAEHISQEHAARFIDSLINASDFILFSAAVPGQGRTHHVNEQWPDYWNRLFNERGYIAADFLRKRLWNENVAVWYKQNSFLYIKKERINDISVSVSDLCIEHPPFSLIHPELYLRNERLTAFQMSIPQIGKIVIKRIIKRLMGKKLTATIKKIVMAR